MVSRSLIMHVSRVGCGKSFPSRRKAKISENRHKMGKFAQKWLFLQIFQRKLKSVQKFSNQCHLATSENRSSLPKIGENDRKSVLLATLLLGQILSGFLACPGPI